MNTNVGEFTQLWLPPEGCAGKAGFTEAAFAGESYLQLGVTPNHILAAQFYLHACLYVPLFSFSCPAAIALAHSRCCINMWLELAK